MGWRDIVGVGRWWGRGVVGVGRWRGRVCSGVERYSRSGEMVG